MANVRYLATVTAVCSVCLAGMGIGGIADHQAENACTCRPVTIPALFEQGDTDSGVPFPVVGEIRLQSIRTTSAGLSLSIRWTDDESGIERIWETMDGGRNWRQVPNDPPSNLTFPQVAIHEAPSDPKILYRRIQGDVFLYLRSSDGGDTWEFPDFNVTGLSWREFARSAAKARTFKPWFQIIGVHPQEPKTLYATIRVVPWSHSLLRLREDESQYLGVFVSHDAGDNWSFLTDTLNYDAPIGISASNPAIMYGHGKFGIVKSRDGGNTWFPVGQQELLEASLEFRGESPAARKQRRDFPLEVKQFAVAMSDPNTVYVVTNKGVFRSLNGGETWCLADLGFNYKDAVSSIAINPPNKADIFVGTRFGVFQSSDAGCNFRKIFPFDSD